MSLVYCVFGTQCTLLLAVLQISCHHISFEKVMPLNTEKLYCKQRVSYALWSYLLLMSLPQYSYMSQ